MRFAKLLIGFAISALLMMGSAWGVQADPASTVEGWVSVTSGGDFNVQFCGGMVQQGSDWVFSSVSQISYSSQAVSLQSDSKASVHLKICYTDTRPTRGEFTTSLRSGGFQKESQGPLLNWIVKPTSVNFEAAGRSGTGVGYIGVYDGQNSLPMDSGIHPWRGTDISSSQQIGYANAGGGTAGSDSGNFIPGTVIGVSVEVTIPAGTEEGNYRNVFILDIIPQNP